MLMKIVGEILKKVTKIFGRNCKILRKWSGNLETIYKYKKTGLDKLCANNLKKFRRKFDKLELFRNIQNISYTYWNILMEI